MSSGNFSNVDFGYQVSRLIIPVARVSDFLNITDQKNSS